MTDHDPTVDKDGRDVSEFITDAVTALRKDPRTARVLCHYYKTGRLGVWSYKSVFDGGLVRLAQKHGYKLEFVKERSMNSPRPDGKAVAYAEFTPAEHRE